MDSLNNLQQSTIFFQDESYDKALEGFQMSV